MLTGVYSPSYSRKRQGVIFDSVIKLVLKPSWPPAGEKQQKGKKKGKKLIKEAFLALTLDSCFWPLGACFQIKGSPS